tara:strand:+ start:3702 stop:4682 length:981 start_codon:yes stop_codon:yes gene_type:complete
MSDLWEHIDLCSGIGGFSLGFQWAELSEPILFCELDEFCQKILKKHWPDVPICNDVKELANDTNAFIPRTRGRKRILTAGYPCQPFSQAGQRRGTEDPRHIWPYILRIIQQERFDVCVFENVSGHISLGLDEVLNDLEGEGYTTRTFVLPAEACGASHRRDRLWIIARNMAYTNDQGIRTRQRGSISEPLQQNDAGNNHAERVGDYDGNKDGEPQVLQKDAEDVADTNNERSQRWLHGRSDQKRQSIKRHSGCSSTIHGQPEERKQATQQRLGRMVDGLSPWMDEPVDIPRVASGQKNRTHRLRALGNAIVPQIAQRIGIAIRESF